jgi:hypothetical protein
MSSNYMFAFRRSAPAPVAPKAHKAPLVAHKAPLVAPKAPLVAPKVLSRSDRFSLNRLIHYKATGGCRSCS